MRLIISLILATCSLASNGQTTWSLSWSEEFSGSTLNTETWNYDIGTGNWGWGNNELQYYTTSPQNLYLENGVAHFVAKQQTFGTSNYTSARINSSGKFNFTYGRLEARIKIPMGQGLWPAFWGLGQNINQVGWPSCGEIDIMEHVNNNDYINGTLHWDQNGHQYNGSTISFDPNVFHQYMIEWDENKIQWYLDGILFKTISITANNMNAFHQPFFIILNVAVGGLWPGSPDNTTVFPAEMLVDYIRYYEKSTVSSTTIENTEALIFLGDQKIHYQIPQNGSIDYSVFNATGQLLIQNTTSLNLGEIDISGLSQGVHIIEFVDHKSGWVIRKKICI